jgi:predicted DNA-binding transcriptional regulator AlpA
MLTDTRPTAEGPPALSARGLAVTPLLLPARQAAAACSVATSTWWRLHASAKVPAPIRLGGRTLWRAEELRDWTAAGCPDRQTWEAQRDGPAQGNGRGA